MTARRIQYLPLDKIAPATRNAKSHNTELVRASVSRFGFVEPVVLDERTGRLVAGHGRRDELLARKAAGEKPPDGVRVSKGEWLIPVVCGWSSANDGEAEAAGIALNQSTIAGGWDDATLVELLSELAESDRGLEGLGFDHVDLDELIRHVEFDARVAVEGDPDVVPEPPKVAVTQPGDLWVLGDHRVLCGDATSEADVKRLMDGEVPDLVLTDPPYGINAVGKSGRVGGHVGTNAPRFTGPPIIGDDRPFDPAHLLATDVPHILWGANHYADRLPIGTRWLVWDKKDGAFEGSGMGDAELAWSDLDGAVRMLHHTWQGMYRKGEGERSPRVHPTQKPVDLMAWCMSQVPEARRVLDPYAGSGSTLIAAHRDGRVALVAEISPAYCDVICARFQRLSGIVPLRDGQPHDFLAE